LTDVAHDDICEIELGAATSLLHVVAAANRFAVTLRSPRAGVIPGAYLPRTISTREDIVHWATRLALYRVRAGDAESPELARACLFFRRAAARADQIGPRRESSARFRE